MNEKKLSRRDFIRGAGKVSLGAATLNLIATPTPTFAEEAQKNEQTAQEVTELKSALTTVAEISNINIVEVTNLLGSDGNFEDFTFSAQHWYKSDNNVSASVTDNVLTLYCTNQYSSLRHDFSLYPNHKYYMFGTFNTGATAYMSINVSNPLIGIRNTASEWRFKSGIYTKTTGSTPQSATFVISDSSTTPTDIYAKKCGIIDLTETFGDGNEPTKDEMDSAMHLVNDWINHGNLYMVSAPETIHENYQNKKILFMGDSITAANLADNGWCKYFNAIMKPAKTVNVAVSGAVWRDYADTVYDGIPSTHNQTNNTIGNQVEKIMRGKDTSDPNYSHVADYDDFDIIIISAGTNDGSTAFNSDDIRDALVDAQWGNPIPFTQINTKKGVGAMAYAYERLYTVYPNAKFFYCTPIQTYPPKKLWGENQNKGTVMKEMGNFIPPIIIDSEKCGIFGNQEQYNTEGVNLLDGLHPNAHGAKLLGEYNANAIIQWYLGRQIT